MAFGAIYWPASLGYLASSPGVLLLAFSLALLPLTSKPLRSPPSRNAWRLLGYGAMVSVLSVLVFGWSTLFAAKSLSLLILSAIWLAPLLCIDHLKLEHLRPALISGVAICFVGYLLGDLPPAGMPGAVKAVIFGGGYDDYQHLRSRAFLQENSHLAALVGRYVLMLFILSEASRKFSARRFTVFMIGLAVLLALIGSKGSAVSIVAAVLSVSLTRRQFPYLIFLAPLIWWVGETQVEAISYDIDNFMSTSTRLTLGVASIAAIASNPLGYGYYGFYGAIQNFGGWSVGWLSDQVPLIFTEVIGIVEELNNVSTKSTLLDNLLVFGAPFVFMLVSVLKRLHLPDLRVRAALVYLGLSAMSTSGHESISFFLGLTILLRCFPKRFPMSIEQEGQVTALAANSSSAHSSSERSGPTATQ
jgi:hypothetical protein